MLSAYLLACALHAAPPPPTGVVISRRIAAKPAFTAHLAERAAAALTAAQLPQRATPRDLLMELRGVGVTDAARCNDSARCLAKLAANLKLEFLVALAVTQVRTDVAVSVSAVSHDGKTLLRRDFVFSLKEGMDAVDPHFDAFAKALHATLAQPAPVAVAPPPADDRPERTPQQEAPLPAAQPQAQPQPAVPTSAELVARPEPSRPARTVVGVTAIAAGVTAATFAVLGAVSASQAGCLRADPIAGGQVSCLTRAEALAATGRANTHFTVAVSAGGAAVALTGVWVLLGW